MYNDAIKNLRIDRGLTQQQLADAIGVSRSAIGMWEAGTREPNFETCEALADFFNCRLADIVSNDSTRPKDDSYPKEAIPIKRKTWKMLGSVNCGVPKFADQEYETYETTDLGIDADYVLVAKGDSMIGARIYDGDIVYIKQMAIVENGQIAVISVGDDTTLKRIRFDPERQELTLNPENPAYPTMHFSGQELDTIHILGKAVAVEFPIK